MRSVSERPLIHLYPGIDIACQRVLDSVELGIEQIDYWDLYSCFPIAVRIQQQALNLDPTIPPSVTGGMSFAGGPLNNYSLQSTAYMVSLLRQKKSNAVISSVSGSLHKFGIGVWSSNVPKKPYCHKEVSKDEALPSPAKVLIDDYSGDGSISSYTVNYERGKMDKLFMLIDIPKSPNRLIVKSSDMDLMEKASKRDYIGAKAWVKNKQLIRIEK